jgi:hypothetical protein
MAPLTQDELSFESVLSKLMAAEHGLVSRGEWKRSSIHEHGTALFSGGAQGMRVERRACHNCLEVGHLMRECPHPPVQQQDGAGRGGGRDGRGVHNPGRGRGSGNRGHLPGGSRPAGVPPGQQWSITL